MNRLTITDLARSEQLDRPTMAAVRGGWKLAPSRPASVAPDVPPAGRHDTTLTGTPQPGQAQGAGASTTGARGDATAHDGNDGSTRGCGQR